MPAPHNLSATSIEVAMRAPALAGSSGFSDAESRLALAYMLAITACTSCTDNFNTGSASICMSLSPFFSEASSAALRDMFMLRKCTIICRACCDTTLPRRYCLCLNKKNPTAHGMPRGHRCRCNFSLNHRQYCLQEFPNDALSWSACHACLSIAVACAHARMESMPSLPNEAREC